MSLKIVLDDERVIKPQDITYYNERLPLFAVTTAPA
jgi:hypothetical protein